MNKTIQVNFRLSDNEFELLQRYSKDNDLKQSSVIRRAIKAYVQNSSQSVIEFNPVHIDEKVNNKKQEEKLESWQI